MSHARQGRLARWYCDSCTAEPFEGRIPCPKCCGYATTSGQVSEDQVEQRDARTEAGL